MNSPDPDKKTPRGLLSLPLWMQASLCAYEALRRFGNEAKDIYFHALTGGTDRVVAVAVTVERPIAPGEVVDPRSLGVEYGRVALFAYLTQSEAALPGAGPPVSFDEYRAAVLAWNTVSHEERCALWEAGAGGSFDRVDFAVAAQAKGVWKRPADPDGYGNLVDVQRGELVH